MWHFAIAFWWYLTLCEFILIILDSLSVNFDDSGVCSVFWWYLTLLDSFISTSGNMWLFAFWWLLDSLSVNFDDTGVCKCILMVPDSTRACWWHLSTCQCMMMMMMMILDSLISACWWYLTISSSDSNWLHLKTLTAAELPFLCSSESGSSD